MRAIYLSKKKLTKWEKKALLSTQAEKTNTENSSSKAGVAAEGRKELNIAAPIRSRKQKPQPIRKWRWHTIFT